MHNNIYNARRGAAATTTRIRGRASAGAVTIAANNNKHQTAINDDSCSNSGKLAALLVFKPRNSSPHDVVNKL